MNGVYRCPCTKCKNAKYLTPDDVKLHLYKKGFVQGYWTWTSHGEVYDAQPGESTSFGGWNDTGTVLSDYEEPDNDGYNHHHMDTIVNDALRSDESNVVQGPNVNAQSFYNLLQATQQPLYEVCSNHSELSAAMRLLSIKSEHNMSNHCWISSKANAQDLPRRCLLILVNLKRTLMMMTTLRHLIWGMTLLIRR